MRTTAWRRKSCTMWIIIPAMAVLLTGCFQEAGNSVQPTPVSLTSVPAFQTDNGLVTPTPFVTPLPAGGFIAPTDNPNSFLTPTPLSDVPGDSQNNSNDPLNNNNVNSPIISVTDTPEVFAPSPIPQQPLPSPTELTVQIQPSATLLATPTPLPGDLPCRHTVQPGEWFYSIARKFNVTPADLLAVNPRQNPDALQPGDVLNLPNCDPNAAPQQPAANGAQPPTATPPSLLPAPTSLGPATTIPTPIPLSGRNYTVVEGDTLGSIARKFGTTVQALKSANNMTNDFLSIGMVLKIPKSE